MALNASIVQRIDVLREVASVDDLIFDFRSCGMQTLVALVLHRLVSMTLLVRSLVIQNVLKNVALFALSNFENCS